MLISTGDLATGVLASSAIPGVLPPVNHAGAHLIDGALARHTGIAQAVDFGCLGCLHPSDRDRLCPVPGPRSAVGVALHSLTMLIEQRLIHEIAAMQAATTIKLLPPLCPLAVSAADFSHAKELITRARGSSLRWIDSGGTDLPDPERFLTLHSHSHSHGRVSVAPRKSA